jgi:hypothetical protein
MLRVFAGVALLCALSQAQALDAFLVLENGGASITVIDGEQFEPVHRFATSRALAGPPRISADGRFAFFASADGWIVKYDLRTLAAIAETHAGSGANSFAVSGDGQYLAAASADPAGLAVLDADLRVRKRLAVSSPISGVFHAAQRRSFLVAFRDVPELWEVSYDPQAEPIAEGVVHDFRLKEGTFVEGFLNPRRTKLEQPLDDLLILAEGSLAIGAERAGNRTVVVQLDVRRPIARIERTGASRPGSGTAWVASGKRLVAIPDRREGLATIVDTGDWRIVKQLATPGPGSFVRSHPATPHLWADARSSTGRVDTLQLIDKQTLELAARLTPAPGKTLAHLEFDRHGHYAIATFSQPEGALIVFDASTLREVKRLPIRDPVGAYLVPAASNSPPKN